MVKILARGALLSIILLITALSATALGSDYVSNFKRIPTIHNQPPQVAVWKGTPTVVVCDSAPINEKQAKKAVKFWEDLGYNFFSTQYRYDPLEKCRSTSPVGYIVVQLITQDIRIDEDSLAQTHFFVDNDHNEVSWAIIYLKSNVRDTVLEHELGHALGFLHFNKINHIMNSKWTQGGWDTTGLRKVRR